MSIYRNKNFTKRDYECTNIVAIRTAGPAPKTPDDRWEEADETTLRPLQQLWKEGWGKEEITFYGYL